jgi:ring-1,2-phenylacetyl-CoA epoxidase subunit PaaB
MIIKSLDPRVNRAQLDDSDKSGELNPLEHWQTYEVFSQMRRGQHHEHVGSVHAPNHELAIILAKEQYARRGTCVNLWVVKTADVFVTDYADADIFETTPDKFHRDPVSYKVMDRIKAFKEKTAV